MKPSSSQLITTAARFVQGAISDVPSSPVQEVSLVARCSTTASCSVAAPIGSLLEAVGDAVFCLNKGGKILFASQRTVNLIGPEVGVIGKLLVEFALSDYAAAIDRAIAQVLTSGRAGKVSVQLLTRAAAQWFELDFNNYLAPDGSLELLVIGRDLTEQQASIEQLENMATHDALTGLPNRLLLSDRLQTAIDQAKRTGRGFTVLALDLDRFKKINDALGHSMGDSLLRVAGERLRQTLRQVDTLARGCGDEFLAILPGAVSEVEIQTVARRMIAILQLPFEIRGHTLYVGASIGAASFPDHGENEVKLLSHADTAMCRAKEAGEARCVLYDPQKFIQQEFIVYRSQRTPLQYRYDREFHSSNRSSTNNNFRTTGPADRNRYDLEKQFTDTLRNKTRSYTFTGIFKYSGNGSPRNRIYDRSWL